VDFGRHLDNTKRFALQNFGIGVSQSGEHHHGFGQRQAGQFQLSVRPFVVVMFDRSPGAVEDLGPSFLPSQAGTPSL
jgi:hypothetical protein